MPRVHPNMQTRTLTLDTGRRTIDVPVDGNGHARRSIPAAAARARLTRADDSDAIGFTGHAAVFDNRTWIGSKRWGFWEEMAPGCFAKTIQEADIRFLDGHDTVRLLGRNKAETLRLSEDGIGLAVDADMAPTTVGRDVAISIERGDLTQMSFAFDMIEYTWTVLDDGNELLRHTEVALWEVSTVTFPAYEDTDAGLRTDLLAVARANGFDALDVEQLARRLANPDPDLIGTLRTLARAGTPEPATTTRDTSQPAMTTGDPTTITPLALRTLLQRTELTHV